MIGLVLQSLSPVMALCWQSGHQPVLPAMVYGPDMFRYTNSTVLAGMNLVLTLTQRLLVISLVGQSLSPAMVVC